MKLDRSVTLGRAIQSLVAAKTLSNCRPRYVESLRQYLNQFARGRENNWIGTIRVDTIEDWFLSRNESLTTKVGNTGRLSALFAFCVRRGWLLHNPCDRLEKIRIDPKPPFILTVQQCSTLMSYVRHHKPNELAFFTLALFAGVRPEELERITWDAIRFEPQGVTVIIDAAASKVRRRRIIGLEPNACAWMALARARQARLPVRRMTRRRYLDHIERVLGFATWPQDCLRHSAASYLMAKHRDAGRVADMLGNSPSILLRHYRQLVSNDDSDRFWSIGP